MKKKIAILLPYKEQFTKKKSSAASIWVNDYLKISKLNKFTTVFGNLDKYDRPLLKNFLNINLDKFIIGGPKILYQLFELIEKFYLTRIYGKFNCDNKFDLKKINDQMTLEKKIESDSTCHFEIWKR